MGWADRIRKRVSHVVPKLCNKRDPGACDRNGCDAGGGGGDGVRMEREMWEVGEGGEVQPRQGFLSLSSEQLNDCSVLSQCVFVT